MLLALRCLLLLISWLLSYVTTCGKQEAPHHGLGSEITRALEHGPRVDFSDDDRSELGARGLWPRAAVLLARQALEMALKK
jgi:hypothetical protein